MNLGPMEISLIILAVLLLFGYKKLPDASRSLGRSLRIFKGEMKGMREDDLRRSDRPDGDAVDGVIFSPGCNHGPPSWGMPSRSAVTDAAEADVYPPRADPLAR